MDAILSDCYLTALRNKGISMEPLYKAMRGNDLTEAVFAAKDILDKTEFFKHIPRDTSMKSEWTSNKLREEGNVAYCAGRYQMALELYNRALAFAPEHSRAMKLIYSNRSALLLKNSNYLACLKDIETCLAMGCPEDIKDKLLKRKEAVETKTWIEHTALDAAKTPYIRDFFKLNGSRHPDIPCASSNIKIIKELGDQKIVAANDIEVGTVLASETAFTTILNVTNKYFACYYCTMLSMNLMPCSGCCHALFCSKQCEKLSNNEGHHVECQFMDIYKTFNIPKIHIALKSALKMRKMTDSWEEFINASCCFGTDRLEYSSTKEIYDVNETFSLLNTKSDSILIHGKLYYCSFACAGIMHYLRDVSSFLPIGQEEKLNAIRGLLRVTIHLYLYAPPTLVSPCAGSLLQQITKFHMPHCCSFSFAGKIKHSCHPNCLAVSVKNKTVIVAIQPIKPGTELTVTMLGQFMNHKNLIRDVKAVNKKMFQLYGFICDCVCTEDKLTAAQQIMVSKLNLSLWDEITITDDISDIYPKLCEAVAKLYDAPHTDEYRRIFELFMRCILRAQIVAARNIVIDFDHFSLTTT